jgi:hypothetical protein
MNKMKMVFDNDEKRIAHALKVTHYAKLLLKEASGSPEVVISSALLHDIGIQEAEKKYGSTAGPESARLHTDTNGSKGWEAIGWIGLDWPEVLTLSCTSVAATLTHAYHVDNGAVSDVAGGALWGRDDNVAK